MNIHPVIHVSHTVLYVDYSEDSASVVARRPELVPAIEEEEIVVDSIPICKKR